MTSIFLRQPIQRQFSQKWKNFSQFISKFLKSILKFEHFRKTINLIADVFSKLRALKNVLKQISKKSSFRGPFDKQSSKWDQTLLKSEPHHLYDISCSLWRKLRCRKFLLVLRKFRKVFVNILARDDKYPFLNRDNLRQTINMNLSQKQKAFSDFVSGFLKGILNFQDFQ